jgi:hypothetical protein
VPVPVLLQLLNLNGCSRRSDCPQDRGRRHFPHNSKTEKSNRKLLVSKSSSASRFAACESHQARVRLIPQITNESGELQSPVLACSLESERFVFKASFRFVALVFLTGMASSQSCQGAILYSVNNSTYSQNFDGLSSVNNTNGATPAWTNNTTISGGGWHSNRSLFQVGAGSDNTGNLYSFGPSGNTDRALGSLASGSASLLRYGVVFQNTTGLTLTSFTVGYTGEQWRGRTGPSDTNAQLLSVDYRLSNSEDGILVNTGAVALAALNFTNLQTGGGALNGNLATNRTVKGPVTTGLVWSPGEFLWVRWTDVDNTGGDDSLAIDDFTFSAFGNGPAQVPEPGTLICLSVVALGCAARRRFSRGAV